MFLKRSSTGADVATLLGVLGFLAVPPILLSFTDSSSKLYVGTIIVAAVGNYFLFVQTVRTAGGRRRMQPLWLLAGYVLLHSPLCGDE